MRDEDFGSECRVDSPEHEMLKQPDGALRVR